MAPTVLIRDSPGRLAQTQHDRDHVDSEAPIGNAVSLSDGVMNLTLLHFPAGTNGGKGGPDWTGLHHFGFIVDDEGATKQAIEKHGGEFFMRLPQYPGVDAETKFKDPNGIVFDVTEHGWG